MEKSDNSALDKNPFTEVFQEFDENEFFKNLHNKVKNKRYFEKYRGFKNTLLALSYLFNTLSALTACYAVYWLIDWLTGIAWLGYAVAIVFLFFLEKLKRKSSGEFWQLFFFQRKTDAGWLSLSLFCLALSLVSSGFGVKRGTHNLSPAPELLHADSTLKAYQAEVVLLESKSADLRGNKNEDGITYYNLADAIIATEKSLQDYRGKILVLEKKLEGKNDQLSSAYMDEVELTANTLMLLTLLTELLFEACMAYVWFFYHRSYVERGLKLAEAQNTIPPTISNNHTDFAALQARIEQLTAENESLRSVHSAPPQINGHEGQNRTPIGFVMPYDEKVAENVCADVHTDIADRFTVPHTYQRGGEIVTVHYTMTNIKSRINQYSRELQKAIELPLADEVVNNRRQWLSYWQAKKEELKEKGSAVTA